MASRLPIPLTARILVVRALPGLGDLLCSVPMLRSLRQAFPIAHITWLGLPGTEWFGQRFAHLLDDWLPFPGFPGIPEGAQSPQATVDFLRGAHGHPHDLVLQVHGHGSVMNAFVALLGGRQQGGFYLPGQYCPDARYFMPYPQQVSEVDRLLHLAQFLGFSKANQSLEFPISEEEAQAGLGLLTTYSLDPGRYVCVHPGASSEDRRWSLAGFAQMSQQLTQLGYRVVLTGTATERKLSDQICLAVQESGGSIPINLAAHTSLGELAVLLSHSALLVCNDTGISHLAVALEAPSVVIFSNSEVVRWAPSDSTRHRVVDSRETTDRTLDVLMAQAQALLHTAQQKPQGLREVRRVA